MHHARRMHLVTGHSHLEQSTWCNPGFVIAPFVCLTALWLVIFNWNRRNVLNNLTNLRKWVQYRFPMSTNYCIWFFFFCLCLIVRTKLLRSCTNVTTSSLAIQSTHLSCCESLYWHTIVICLSVCLSVILHVVAAQYILQQKCLNKWIGNAILGTRFYNF